MLKIPYAIRDFDKLIRGKFIYMDRTDRIPILEDLGYELLFLRPRRFGKSLWLSTLMNYYDVAKADYHNLLKSPVRINPENALASFHSAVAATRRTPYKLYLFIDEYDNFANEVMMGQQGDNRKRYNDLVSGEGL